MILDALQGIVQSAINFFRVLGCRAVALELKRRLQQIRRVGIRDPAPPAENNGLRNGEIFRQALVIDAAAHNRSQGRLRPQVAMHNVFRIDHHTTSFSFDMKRELFLSSAGFKYGCGPPKPEPNSIHAPRPDVVTSPHFSLLFFHF